MAPEQQLYNGNMEATRAPGCILATAAGNPPTTMQTSRPRPQNWCHGGAASTIPTACNLQEVGHHHAASEVQRTPSRYKATRAPGCALTAAAGNTPTKMQTRRPQPHNWYHGGAASTIPTASNLQEAEHHHAASEVQPTPSPSRATRAPGCTLTAAAGNTPTKMQTRRQRPFLTCTNLTGIYYIYTKVKFGTSPGMSACGMSHAPEQGSMGQGTSLYTDDMRTNFGFDEFFTIKRKKEPKKENWLP